MRRFVFCLIWAFAAAVMAAGPARARDDFRLSAPDALVDSGLLKYALPRFSLKTQVRITLVGATETAEMVLAPDGDGTPVFTGAGATWRMRLLAADHPGVARFAEWLTSEVGQRTVTGFKVDGAAPFTLPVVKKAKVAALTFDGDAVEGRKLSHQHCGRCHVVSEDNRMDAIGSTPSFFLLRGFRDWGRRFQAFYALNPHPAFTQVAEVTAPFPIDRPSPIIPVEITLDDLEAILAYVSAISPADLGAPLAHQ